MTNKNLSPAKRALLEKWLEGQANRDTKTIPRRPTNGPIPLSFPQKGQLFLQLLEPTTAVNNLSIFLELNGKLDHAALNQSANQIIARHEVLRTRFSFSQGFPTLDVLTDLKITIPIVDLQKFNVIEQLTKARQLAEREVVQPFDLTKAPLIRIKLYVLSIEKYLLLVIVHHAIADGWSLGVFLKELMLFYQANTTGKLTPVPELDIQYSDYAYWQADEKFQESWKSSGTYWKKQLGGELPMLELPIFQARVARQTYRGGTYRFQISKDQTESLLELGRQEDATLFMTLLTAFYILLHRYCNQDDIIIGTPIANRNYPELQNLIGVFINTLALRANLSGDPSFRQLLKDVRTISLGAYAHQDFPFEKLVEELKPKRDLNRTPLFQVVFNLQNSPMPKLEITDLQTSFLDIDSGVSQFDLTLMVSKMEKQCRATVEYNADLFSPATITRMFHSFQMILDYALIQPDSPISKLQLVTQEELRRVVYEFNQTHFDFPRDKCMHQLIEEQVELTPDAMAIIYDQTSITYRELNQRANALAMHLQDLGVGPNVRVGILMNKSLEIVQALFGILKTGGTYVPIHTSIPIARLQFILQDAQVQILLTNLDPLPLEEDEVQIVNLSDSLFLSQRAYENPQAQLSSDQLAYIIYTSGSTGKPKGVMIDHKSLMNFLWSMREKPGIKKDDVLMAVTSISFDIAALELYLPLIVGATVVIASEEMIANPLLISEAIVRHNVNVMQATPATWQLLLQTGWTGKSDLKALCGGDALTRQLADQLLDRVGSLWNMYGPTETTIWSSISLIQKNDTPISIGQPIGNTQLYILDRYLQTTPLGVVSELHIGGEGLARGYLNRPEMTREKFIPDHISDQPGARLYKTGDLARYLPDDSIEILGRMDDQLKINGHRIELGEITAILVQHPLVNDGIVIIQTESTGAKQLVAYLVCKRGLSPEFGELREFIGQKLPAYMIPTFFVEMDALPLTPNGKIDRKSLPMAEVIRQNSGYLAPRTEEEQILVKIWENALGIDQVGINDNFFDLGGASIQSIEIVAKSNMYGFQLSVEHIFEHQTIAELAEHIKGGLQ